MINSTTLGLVLGVDCFFIVSHSSDLLTYTTKVSIMNKTMTKLFNCLSSGTSCKARGQNMETGENGIRYQVAVVEGCMRLFYWGHEVATFNSDGSLTIDCCGYYTVTTKRLIDMALMVFWKDAGECPKGLYQSNHEWFIMEPGKKAQSWDGEALRIA